MTSSGLAIFMTGSMGAFVFPTLLAAVYAYFWLKIGRDPKVKTVVPQYEPPDGVSPGVARYIETGGSDGTSIAAILANLAANRVVSIHTQDTRYLVRLEDATAVVWPEEAAVIEQLFAIAMSTRDYQPGRKASVEKPPLPQMAMQRGAWPTVTAATSAAAAAAAKPAATEVLLDPKAAIEIKACLDAVQATFRKNLSEVYFKWNAVYGIVGAAVTLLWTISGGIFSGTGTPAFLAVWLFIFTTLAGIVAGGTLTAKQSNPTVAQRMQRLMLPLLFYIVPGALIYLLGMPNGQTFVLSLLIAVALNCTALVIMRAPTPLGQKTIEHLAGFREFLLRVEQDQLERVNERVDRADIMNRFLPYAIALNVHEGWGDKMAAAFSNVAVER